MYPVLNGVALECIKSLVDRLKNFLIDDDSFTATVYQTRLNITVLKIERYFQYKIGKVNPSKELKKLLSLYKKSLVLEVKDERERQFGDDYIVLAAHSVLEEYIISRGKRITL